MNYSELTKVLLANKSKELIFKLDGYQVEPHYHITEVLKNEVTTLDCGKKIHKWSELVLQLVEPTNPPQGREVFTSVKAFGILSKSETEFSVTEDSQLTIEYRPKNSLAAARYVVNNIEIKEDSIEVISNGAATQCKASTRGDCGSSSAKKEGQCCA